MSTAADFKGEFRLSYLPTTWLSLAVVYAVDLGVREQKSLLQQQTVVERRPDNLVMLFLVLRELSPRSE